MLTGRDRALELLRVSVESPTADFRPGQWEAIEQLVVSHRRLLMIQRTGWGKSSVYFISTRMLRDLGGGPTLIVSPLLSLMRNQLQAAARLSVLAVTINSANASEWEKIQEQLRADEVDALLISPERLANEQFTDDVLMPIAGRIGMLVVDEAHCISDWGHDFRPDYRRLVQILLRLPGNLPLIATTATANNRVLRDVSRQLGDAEVVRGPLMRESLVLQVQGCTSRSERLGWLAHNVPRLPGSGIVYALTVRDAEAVALWLRERGV